MNQNAMMRNAMMRKLMQLKKEMAEMQKELEESEFTASVGDTVTVTVSGAKELLGIKINESYEVTEPEDLEMLADMIIAACKKAYKEVERVTEEKTGKYSDLLGGMI